MKKKNYQSPSVKETRINYPRICQLIAGSGSNIFSGSKKATVTTTEGVEKILMD